MKRQIKVATRGGWQNNWLSVEQESRKLKEIKFDISEWNSSYNKIRELRHSCPTLDWTYQHHSFISIYLYTLAVSPSLVGSRQHKEITKTMGVLLRSSSNDG